MAEKPRLCLGRLSNCFLKQLISTKFFSLRNLYTKTLLYKAVKKSSQTKP
ncbi:hypothetical protein KFK09_005837 [Dendrobium nobile]|uniref:Uncharacterized protein n=1 Tax=Dendrobium nobile TaxID=94219 RepID=A0A8T3BZE0_DENNO|nr:hypothetical protein KFK09_005837 [Dendrobium nobile]